MLLMHQRLSDHTRGRRSLVPTSLLALLLAGFSLPAAAQQAPSLPVVAAERGFARMALDSGIRKAFLAHMDDGSMVFRDGRILHGRRHLETPTERPPSPAVQSSAPTPPGGLLQWQPVFAAMSADGASGFTTGPFEFRARAGGPVLHSGHYCTTWRKNEQGIWHFEADLGIGHDTSVYQASPPPVRIFEGNTPAPATDTALYRLDSLFNDHLQHDARAILHEVLLPASQCNLSGTLPLRSNQTIIDSLVPKLPGMTFLTLQSTVAGSRDMAFTYGESVRSDTGRRNNYLRVWVHTPQGWKILLMVVER
ncbi:hypothetical protein ACWKWU_03015 [Chitinophaga lutea]